MKQQEVALEAVLLKQVLLLLLLLLRSEMGRWAAAAVPVAHAKTSARLCR